MPAGGRAGTRLPLHRGIWDWPSLPVSKGWEGVPCPGTAVGSQVLIRGTVGLRLLARFPLRTGAGTRMRPAPQHGSPES